MATRLSNQQRMILMILFENGERSIGLSVLKYSLLKTKGLGWESKSFRASYSRTLKTMHRKELVRLDHYRWNLGSCGRFVSRFVRLTSFGFWTAERLKDENNRKSKPPYHGQTSNP